MQVTCSDSCHFSSGDVEFWDELEAHAWGLNLLSLRLIPQDTKATVHVSPLHVKHRLKDASAALVHIVVALVDIMIRSRGLFRALLTLKAECSHLLCVRESASSQYLDAGSTLFLM